MDGQHIYTDAGISGKSTHREQFQAMMQAARAGEIHRIVAMKLDRIARNTKDFLAIVETLQGYGCDLVLIKEAFDTSTPQGKFFMTMSAAMAEFEASTITERVMSGKAQKAQEGGYNGAQCPLGYQYTNGAFTVDSGAAHWVREIFTRFTAGQGMSKIADDLNAAGAMTARGGKWYAGTVRYLLLNGFYAGLSQWDGVEQPGSHPAIISRELYEQAHQRLQANKLGLDAINAGTEIRLRADRKMGEVLILAKETGEIKRGNPQLSGDRIIRLKDVGVSLNQSSTAQQADFLMALGERRALTDLSHKLMGLPANVS